MTSSTETGTAVRDSGINPWLGIVGPPVYGGLSWTKRSLMMFGAMMNA